MIRMTTLRSDPVVASLVTTVAKTLGLVKVVSAGVLVLVVSAPSTCPAGLVASGGVVGVVVVPGVVGVVGGVVGTTGVVGGVLTAVVA